MISAKATIFIVDEKNIPIEGAKAGIAFETNKLNGSGVNITYIDGFTDGGGMLTLSNRNDSNTLIYGAEKEGYYFSKGRFNFSKSSFIGWEPWNPVIKVVMRKIENPVPMYARNAKFSKIKIPVVGKDIGFDLIRCDWVKPYGKGEYSDFLVNLTSMVENVNNYDFTATIKFEGYNGFIKYIENVKNGSQYKLPRFAPESGYEKILKTYDRTKKGKNRDVSWSINQHYMFRVRSVVDKNNNFEKAMHGKIVGDIHLGPQRDGTAYIEFKYYLNPDYTRNLEFDPKRNLFGNLPNLEQVNEP